MNSSSNGWNLKMDVWHIRGIKSGIDPMMMKRNSTCAATVRMNVLFLAITKEAAAIFGLVGWWSCVEWIKKWASRKISGIKHYGFFCLFFSIVFKGSKYAMNQQSDVFRLSCVPTFAHACRCTCIDSALGVCMSRVAKSQYPRLICQGQSPDYMPMITTTCCKNGLLTLAPHEKRWNLESLECKGHGKREWKTATSNTLNSALHPFMSFICFAARWAPTIHK